MKKLIIPVILTMLVMAAFSQTTYVTEFGEAELERLALQGNAEAQFQLGIIYELGRGVPEDSAEASRWFRMTAFLGIEVRRGRGVPQDYAESVKWWRASAEQGLGISQMQLGNSYVQGRGVPKDYVQAHKWFNLSTVDHGFGQRGSGARTAEILLTLNQSARDDLAKKMTREQVAEAQRLATEWKPKTWAVIRKVLEIE